MLASANNTTIPQYDRESLLGEFVETNTYRVLNPVTFNLPLALAVLIEIILALLMIAFGGITIIQEKQAHHYAVRRWHFYHLASARCLWRRDGGCWDDGWGRLRRPGPLIRKSLRDTVLKEGII